MSILLPPTFNPVFPIRHMAEGLPRQIGEGAKISNGLPGQACFPTFLAVGGAGAFHGGGNIHPRSITHAHR